MSDIKGDLCIRVVAFPADTNPSGNIFGGWLMSQMDTAGGVFCRKIVKGRVVTVAVSAMEFLHPVFVGDTLCCYVDLVKINTTSMTVHIEAWVNRGFDDTGRVKVTEGTFTYVKLGDDLKPAKIN